MLTLGKRWDCPLYHVNFLICRRCFWCASKLDASRELTEMCPICDNDDKSIESLPVADSTISEILSTTLYLNSDL